MRERGFSALERWPRPRPSADEDRRGGRSGPDLRHSPGSRSTGRVPAPWTSSRPRSVRGSAILVGRHRRRGRAGAARLGARPPRAAERPLPLHPGRHLPAAARADRRRPRLVPGGQGPPGRGGRADGRRDRSARRSGAPGCATRPGWASGRSRPGWRAGAAREAADEDVGAQEQLRLHAEAADRCAAREAPRSWSRACWRRPTRPRPRFSRCPGASATAPSRRYADLATQRLLKAALAGRPSPCSGERARRAGRLRAPAARKRPSRVEAELAPDILPPPCAGSISRPAARATARASPRSSPACPPGCGSTSTSWPATSPAASTATAAATA